MNEGRDPAVFGRNVRAFRTLRGWGIRELSERANVSTKTIVKIEQGLGCTTRTEQKIAAGFTMYLGRLWDASLLTGQRQRVIHKSQGRWFFGEITDAERYHQRLVKSQPDLSEVRFRSDPDEIQDETERHRLGYAGLSKVFAKAMGGGMAAGYYQYNQCEIFSHDVTPGDGFNYSYICFCIRGSLRIGMRGEVFELNEGDTIVFEGGDDYWIEPLEPLRPPKPPPLIQFACLKMLDLPR